MTIGCIGKSAVTLVLLLVAVLAGFALGRREPPPRTVSGKLLYERHCASCHGTEGRGDGPAAEARDPRPADLTRLQARLGGSYSMDQLMRAIDGRRTVRAHGTSAMPVWGRLFEEELKDEPHARRVTLLHVQARAEYLHTLQASPSPR
jgi:mono/diheme cytochrome c family protein